MPIRFLIQVAAVATALVGVGLFDLPYGYYMLLRLALCGSAVVFAIESHDRGWMPAVWIFGLFTVLYNPFVPVHLGEKEVWTWINAATVSCFWLTVGVPLLQQKAAATVPSTLAQPKAARSHAEIVATRDQLTRGLRVSEFQPRSMLVGIPVTANCMLCKQPFKHVTGALPLLETEEGVKGLLCVPCLKRWNGLRSDVGLFPIAFTE